MARRPRVVIVGGGFGGIAAAQRLRHADVDVVVIDRTNHFVFQPFLYQVASGTLAPSDIAVPIRWYLRRQTNTRVVLGAVTAIDTGQRSVVIDNGVRTEPYDFLILAAGGRHSYFGHDEWEPFAPGLKTLADALEVRSRFLDTFERAELESDPQERDALLTIVIVGGGPTGVELAGIMATIARKVLPSDFRAIDTTTTRVLLVEAGPRLLPTFPESLGRSALRDLSAMGVDVRLNATVAEVDEASVRIGENRIATRTVFWAAGNTASMLTRGLGATDHAGRLLVNADLSVTGLPDVFAVGDLALTGQLNGKPTPGVCQAAMQGGALAAENVLRTLRRQPRRDFRYANRGDMATIGRHSAVADLGFARFDGFFAWLLWLFVHILYLAGFRNRLVVLLEWGWEYLTYQRGVRLIVAGKRVSG